MRAKKSLGQNFLIDPNLQRKIVEALDPSPSDVVLEIGPGHGALTRLLVGRVAHLILVELDDELAGELEAGWGDRPDVEVRHQDFLELDLRTVAEDPTRLRILGNIPYNITAPIIFKLLERPRPKDIVLMVQHEVGERLCSLPGSRIYGSISVFIQTFMSVNLELYVSPEAFWPRPKVKSVVLRLKPYDRPIVNIADEILYEKIIRASFSSRRKILLNSLSSLFPRDKTERILNSSGIDKKRRAETLSIEEFVKLTEEALKLN